MEHKDLEAVLGWMKANKLEFYAITMYTFYTAVL